MSGEPRVLATNPQVVLCHCAHARIRHTAELEGMCAVPHCECIGFRLPASPASVPPREPIKSARRVSLATRPVSPEPLAPDEKTCTKCGQTKPLDEFYERYTGSGDRMPSCRDCDMARPRGRSTAKIVRVRARHRATAELIRLHDDEFRELLTRFTEEATDEAERLATHPMAPASHGEAETVRLKPGQRRKGQESTDRIDVARCPHCIKHHDRGHLCAECGAAPAPNVVAAWQTSNRHAKDASKQEASNKKLVSGIAAWAAS